MSNEITKQIPKRKEITFLRIRFYDGIIEDMKVDTHIITSLNELFFDNPYILINHWNAVAIYRNGRPFTGSFYILQKVRRLRKQYSKKGEENATNSKT